MESADISHSALAGLSAEPAILAPLTADQKRRLSLLLDCYLAALERDEPQCREVLLDANPDLAAALRLYFERLDGLHSACQRLYPARGSPARVVSVVDRASICGDVAWERRGGPCCSAGERRLGDFLLEDEIGRGGMGIVYSAQQISLGRRVALKVLPFAAVLDARQITRFKNEARAAAQLQHPHIVPVFAVGEERGVHYYAMQYIDGQPLDRAIAELRGPRPGGHARTAATQTGASISGTVTQAASLLRGQSSDRRQRFTTIMRLGIEAAEALHAAHELGVVHRDIKPSNLLLDRDGKLWVTDFGLALVHSDNTLSRFGDVVGTIRYMSPEQARGQSVLVDHRTDVYSLGATLYELLALRPAFPADDPRTLLREIVQCEPPRLRQYSAGIPADLETVVAKAMAKSRDERYATARELADDLRRVRDGRPTLARQPTLGDRLLRWAQRHRRLVAASAAAGLLLAIGLGVMRSGFSSSSSRSNLAIRKHCAAWRRP